MLEQMRKSSQSLLIYVLFGIVIAVFIINFGPQSRGGSCEQSMKDDHQAATVDGRSVTSNDFRYGFLVMGGAGYPAQEAKRQRLKETVMDKLIERELLAREAERLGYSVSDEQVEDQIAEAKLIGLGYPRTIPRMQKDGKFNYESFKSFVQYELQVTLPAFIEEQRKELLAARVRDLLRGSVTVSPTEVKADYLRKNTQVNLEYVRFASRGLEGDIEPSEAEVAAYAAKNEAKLKTMYEERKFVFEKVPKELRLRQIVVKLPPDAKADAEKTATKKAEAILARIKKGEPVREGREGDDRGREPARARRLPRAGAATARPTCRASPEKKLFDAKVGDVVGPLKGGSGLYITKVEGSREGNVPFADVKLELAEEKVRAEKAGAQAKARAEAALATARAEIAKTPTKTLKDVFPAPQEKERPQGQGPRACSVRVLGAARRGDGSVRAARDARGRARRGHRRVERGGQGRLLAQGGRAAGRPLRGVGELGHRPAQGAQEPGRHRVREEEGRARARRGAHEVDRGPDGLDARALRRGQGGQAHPREPRRPPLRGQRRAASVRALRAPPPDGGMMTP
jgi:peptidyl-prolyl cis-trans isomerase D